MTSVLVLYYSRHGSVAELASQVAYGVESVDGCEAVLRTVPPVSSVAEATAPAIPEEGDVYAEPADLMSCDALVLGSPTRFGTVASPIKYFFDQTAPQWMAGTLKDKPAGVFTSTTSMHGGQESTLLGMMLPLIHHGMVMVGLPFSGTALSHTRTGGTPYGASHVAGADNNAPFSEDEVRLARLLGSRVANAAVLLKGSAL
ncbi:MAG: NAD(P)H:quinone oxidoreductase [Gammaproteobacteria bacterium]|nr:NAD(P)H:quinone oxidoreductase [Gammaproteobacteria bacterium]